MMSTCAEYPPAVVLTAIGRLFLLAALLFSVTLGGMCGCEHRYDLLMELYDATNGPQWMNRDGWGIWAPCGTDWYGVTCAAGDITAVDLSGNNLSGTLPSSWSNMSHLVTLLLRSNHLSGSLPSVWGEMSKLRNLRLNTNRLSGSLSSDWGQMRNLQDLFLFANSLSGSLPSAWSNLPSISTLALYTNSLSGNLPWEWSNMSSLKYLHLGVNYLIGPLPSEWSNMTSLQYLHLGVNSLSSSLPTEWSSMPRLYFLQLYTNRLFGTLPGAWCSMSSLDDLQLHANSLSGTLPFEWAQMPKLQVLQLAANSLSGSLPPTWSNISTLQTLQLQTNSFSGTLPPEWSSMSSLQFLNVGINNLTGTLPQEWAHLSSLQDLHLFGNRLSGSLPSAWSNLHSISTLVLYTNSLSGILPPEWSKLSSLQYLHVGVNSLSGILPSSWSNMSSLKYLHVGLNSLSGTLPAEWSRMSNIQTMQLHTNRLSGNLPFEWAQMTKAQLLHFGSNNLRGSLPSSWSNMSSLRNLNLGANSLSGILPSQWSNIINLTNLQLQNNCLQGALPASYSNLTQLQTMDVCRTRVSGGYRPAVLANCAGGGAAVWPLYCNPTESSTHASVTFAHSGSPTATHSPSTWVCAVSPLDIALSLPALQSIAVIAPGTSSRPIVIVTAVGDVGAVPAEPASTHDAALAVVTARPIEREMLTAAPHLAFNLTIAAPTSAVRWAIANVTMGGQLLNYTAVSPNTEPSHAVLVRAPEGGWLAPRTPVLADRTVELRVVMACDNEAVLAVDLRVPAPGVPREFAGRVVTATEYSQLASVLAGGATSGSALGRTMATRSMVMCDADAAVGGGVLDLDLNPCGDSPATGGTAAARSAVLSNYILVGCVGTILLVLALLWAHLRGCSLSDALRALSLPSTLLPACTVVLPSTSASVTLLAGRLGSSPCTATDAALALAGTILVLLPTGGVLAVWRRSIFNARPAWVCVHREAARDAPGSRLLAVWQRALRRNWKWVAAAAEDGEKTKMSADDDGAMRSAWVVLLEYRVVWYAALDSGALSVVACLAVVGGLDAPNPPLCRACSGALIVLIAAQLAVLIAVRPFTTLFSLVHAVVSLSLTCLSVVAQLIFVEVSATDSSGLWLAQFSAACDLGVVGVTAVRVLFDVSEVAAAARRRIALLRGGARPGGAAGDQLAAPLAEVFTVADDRLEKEDDAPLGSRRLAVASAPRSKSKCGDEDKVIEARHIVKLPTTDGSPWSTASPCDARRPDGMSKEDAEVLRMVEMDFWDASGAAMVRFPSDDDNNVLDELRISTRAPLSKANQRRSI